MSMFKNTPNSYYSYNAFPSRNYRMSSSNIVVGSSFRPGGGIGGSSKTASRKEILAFHSSSQWRIYFEASKRSNKLIVIYFTATWCRPCRSMEPAIKELAAKYAGIELVKIDVDELFNLSCEFRIQTMPTFLFMKNGKEIDRVIGARKEDLQRKVDMHNNA